MKPLIIIIKTYIV